MKRSREMAIYDRMDVKIEHGKFVRTTKPERVRVMVRSEGYAMVRHTGCTPFVVSEKELRPVELEGSK